MNPEKQNQQNPQAQQDQRDEQNKTPGNKRETDQERQAGRDADQQGKKPDRVGQAQQTGKPGEHQAKQTNPGKK